jgi:cysteine-S-conjugate beta-lyase
MSVVIANPLEGVSRERLRTRTRMKWRAHPDDVLPLWVAEMDVDVAEPVQEAIVRAVREGDTGYPSGDSYARALGRLAARRWGWSGFPVDRSALVPDVMLGLVEALKLVTAAGDPVILSPPIYPPFYAFSEHSGRPVVEARLREDGRLDLDALDNAFGRARSGHQRAAYLLCNPHNPTGVVPTAEELAGLAALADRHRVRVISDEIHGPLVLPGAEFVPYLSVASASDAFMVTSASKGWNLAGLKAAVLSGGEAAADDLARLPEEVGHGASHLAVLAHVAALDHGEAWLDALLAGLDANRTRLRALLDEHLPEIGWRPPQATYFAWLDCSQLVLADADLPSGQEESAARGDVTVVTGPAALFLSRGKVALNAGATFGSGGEAFVRLNFATSGELLQDAISRMRAAVSTPT